MFNELVPIAYAASAKYSKCVAAYPSSKNESTGRPSEIASSRASSSRAARMSAASFLSGLPRCCGESTAQAACAACAATTARSTSAVVASGTFLVRVLS